MKWKTHTLENGMRILLAPNASAESVTVMVMSGTGSRFEEKQENGIAHFLEHIVFKGTEKRKNAQIIATEIDAIGGYLNAFTAKDRTAYYAKVDKRHFKTAFDVITDIFLNPTLPAKEIERERGAVVEEINMYSDMPIRAIAEEGDCTVYGQSHPLGRTILGPKKNIKTFSRAQLKKYFEKNYIAENSALCVAGAFDANEVLKLATQTFKDMRTGTLPIAQSYTHAQTKRKVRCITKKIDQTHFHLAFPAYGIHEKNEVVAEVLAAVLGGGMSSRLFSEIREKRGLAYYVRAENDAYDDVGMLAIRAGVANKNVMEALSVTLGELQKIKKHLISEKELSKAKENVKGRLALSLDTTDAQAEHIGFAALIRRDSQSIDAFNTSVDAVTVEHIHAVAEELFQTDKLNMTMIGPHKKTAKLEKLLTLS